MTSIFEQFNGLFVVNVGYLYAMNKGIGQFKALYHRLVIELQLPRSGKLIALWFIDALVMLGAVLFAYWVRLGDAFSPDFTQSLLILSYPVIGLSCFIFSGFYRKMVRFSGDELLLHLIKSVTFATMLWVLLAYVTELNVAGELGAPRTVPPVFWATTIVTLYLLRWSFKWVYWTKSPIHGRKPVVLYGASEAGYRLSRALKHEPGFQLVGVIDSKPEKVGRVFYGVGVFSPNALPTLVSKFNVSECILAVENLNSEEVKNFIVELEAHNVKPRVLPPVSAVVANRNLVSLVREVDVGDLLGRQPVAAFKELLVGSIADKVVLVTGAGGSIGSELCRQICQLGPKRLILLDHSEPALYQINRQLQRLGVCEIVSVLGSVKDESALASVFNDHRIETIYHAAAHKHVPLLESNLAEGFANNVIGTQNVAKFALSHQVEKFVLISSDKAVRPTNVMGSTKRWAEIVIQNLQQQANKFLAEGGQVTRFCAVRFGNVLGSSGSVIPLFKEQIAEGGPVTVTHPEVTRYFMSIHEAAQLVLQASTMAEGGDVFLLDMGESVKIVDLAKNLVKLAGLRPVDPVTGVGDVAIEFVGLRPGEKLYEELLIDASGVRNTPHPKILRASEPYPDESEFYSLIKNVQKLLQRGDESEARDLVIGVANQKFSSVVKPQS